MEVKYQNLREMVEARARESRDEVYIAFYGREITFGAFDEDANRFANGLKRLGVGKGDIVYVYMNNCPEFLVAAVGAAKMGAIAAPINNWLKAEEIKFQLNDSKGKAMALESSYRPVVDSIKAECPHLDHIIELGDSPAEGNHSWAEMLEASPAALDPAEIGRDDIAFIFYTAGTTGTPKGAQLTHWNVAFEIAGIREAMEEADEEDKGHVALIFLPFFHVNAMMSMMASIYRGLKTAVLKKFSVREFGPAVAEHGCSFFSAVPKIYKILLEARDVVRAHDLSSLKYGVCGAAPMPVETIRRFEEVYGVEILEGYGLTEGTVASTLHRRGGMKKIGSIGPALPGQDVRIFDEENNELPSGEVGEIVVRGDNVMVGYLERPEENARTLRGGWLHTGDRGYVDEDGFFFIVDREKDMIIKGGENIYPKEIENVLSSHPAVHDVAVIGVPDEMSGEEVKAFVVPHIGVKVTEEEIIDFCKERMADFKVPKFVDFVIGLPASAIGKVLKRKLREGDGITRLADIDSGEKLDLNVIFQMMPHRINSEKAGAWSASIRYELFGPSGGSWTMIIEEGSGRVEAESTVEPTAVVKMYDQTFMNLVTKQIDAVTAMNSGLMQISGNEADVAMLGEVMT